LLSYANRQNLLAEHRVQAYFTWHAGVVVMALLTPNSLEYAKLAADVLVPISVVGFGFWITRTLEHRKLVSQKVVERRLTVFDEVMPLVNDLYCYYLWIGRWKELSPLAIVDKKRSIDSKIFANEWVLSADFMDAFRRLMDRLFSTYGIPGTDAKLLSSVESGDGNREQDFTAGQWDPTWNARFALSRTDEYEHRPKVKEAYKGFASCIASELGIS
jgi:hypothetical protein